MSGRVIVPGTGTFDTLPKLPSVEMESSAILAGNVEFVQCKVIQHRGLENFQRPFTHLNVAVSPEQSEHVRAWGWSLLVARIRSRPYILL
jgi:hypothetical protein